MYRGPLRAVPGPTQSSTRAHSTAKVEMANGERCFSQGNFCQHPKLPGDTIATKLTKKPPTGSSSQISRQESACLRSLPTDRVRISSREAVGLTSALPVESGVRGTLVFRDVG